MDRLGQEHIKFLQQCAARPTKTHSSDLPFDELQQMADEGLLVKYNRASGAEYCVTAAGAQVARSFGVSPEIKKMALDYITSKNYSAEEAERILSEHGAEAILKSQAEELRGGKTQGEVTVPVNAQGIPEIKIKQSL